MFVHSEKVPRLYKIASKYLREIIENGSSLKELIYNQNKFPNIKALYALLTKTLQHFSEINRIIVKSLLLQNEPKFDPWLARVLITQLFWSNKGLEGTCKPILTILSYRAALENHKLDKNDERTVSKVSKPRYVRVNTLALSLEEAINGFCNEEWELVHCNGKTYDDFITSVGALENHQFMVDVHVKELFIFPPKTEFYNHEAYKCKSVLLQDKASCLPVQVLNPSPGSTVLDMCAAPGMKTSFLAAWLNDQGTVYAVESDTRRYNTLNTIIEGTYATCIKTINKDVLLVTPEQCPNVEYILVDPSCSGSGITDRLTIDDEVEEVNQTRLTKLSYFQQLLLKHALKNFPQAKRVVYSTCSIYTEENECVVDEVLKDNVNFKLVPVDTLLNYPFNKPKQLGDHLDYVRACCIRTTPEEDLTNGFFIAVFERNEENLPDETRSLEDHRVQHETSDGQVKKKKKKVDYERNCLEENLNDQQFVDNVEQPPKRKKKCKKDKDKSKDFYHESEIDLKKKHDNLEVPVEENTKRKLEDHIETKTKKKGKNKLVSSDNQDNERTNDIQDIQRQSKKKKKCIKEDTCTTESPEKSKKKKIVNYPDIESAKDETECLENQTKKDKKKKKRKRHVSEDSLIVDDHLHSGEVVSSTCEGSMKEMKKHKEEDLYNSKLITDDIPSEKLRNKPKKSHKSKKSHQ